MYKGAKMRGNPTIFAPFFYGVIKMDKSSKETLISIQPYFVIEGENFCQRIFVKDGISHFYSFSNINGDDVAVPLLVDSCCNLIFEYKDGKVRSHFIGVTVEKRTFSLKKGAEYFGIRLQPSTIKFIKEYQPKDLVGKIIILDELPSTKEFCRKMGEQPDFESRIQTFLTEYGNFENACTENKKTELFKQIADLIIQKKGRIKVSQLENLSGYTSRYINKILDKELGMNTKQFCNSVKFQFMLGDMNWNNTERLTEFAIEYNYYDQAHFIHEFKEYSGKTPKEYVKEVESCQYRNSVHNT